MTRNPPEPRIRIHPAGVILFGSVAYAAIFVAVFAVVLTVTPASTHPIVVSAFNVALIPLGISVMFSDRPWTAMQSLLSRIAHVEAV